MRINNNIQALNAYRNLSTNQMSTSKSLERLSSGLRINRAADDAAGLAISEKMRSQIRGLQTAERNALDAISLIQTAEGGLNETHAILHRMRELAVQSVNGTLGDQERSALQSELNQLTQEVDRIASSTQFNQKVLLRGSEAGVPFTTTNAEEIGYAGAGVWKGIVTADPTSQAKAEINLDVNFGSELAAGVEGKVFEINGKKYEINTDLTTDTIDPNNIAVNVTWSDGGTDADIAQNINNTLTALHAAIIQNDPETFSSSDSVIQTSVPGTNDGVLDSNGKLILATKGNMSLGAAGKIEISTDAVGASIYDPADSTTPVTTLVGDATALEANAFNLTFQQVPKDGDYIKIDNVTINFGTTGSAYDAGTNSATIDITDKSLTQVLEEISSTLTTAKTSDNNDVAALSTHNVVGNTLVLSTTRTDDGNAFGDTTPDATNGLEVEFGDGDFLATAGRDLLLNMQIGANAGEKVEISISVLDAASLGLARNADGSVLTTPGINAAQGLDITSSESSSAAITAIDNAIIKVSEQRSTLGAFQNRIEHTINNLRTTRENLTTAESRIRDVDMALEMTAFTKNNILNQASQAMLAQANQLPQGILQLLQ